jgi:hypothetical protein
MLLVYVQKKERESAHAQSSGRIFQTAKKKEEKIQITIRNLHAFHKKLVEHV